MNKEHREAISRAKRGSIPWNKGKKCPYLLGNQNGFKKGQIPWNKGMKGQYKQSLEARIKVSASLQNIPVEEWKGFIGLANFRLRISNEYRRWRKAVFERDNWTCQHCGIRGHKGLGRRVVLDADHIKSFSQYPDLRYDIDNGRTLCRECHMKTDTWGVNAIYYERKQSKV